jgi:hypothetical protein
MTCTTARHARHLALPLLVAVAACANEVDSSENKLPYLSEREVVDTAGGDQEVSQTGCECITAGRWYRFDTLALTTIDGKNHPVISTLNNLWQADINGLELSIMLEVSEVSASEIKARVMNGARVDGTQTICRLEHTVVDVTFPRSGCRLEASNESPFNVYAGTETYPKNCSTTLPVRHAIPVSRARLEATVSDDCGRIIGGKVPSGGLGQAELGKICTCLLLPGAPAEDCGALDQSFDANACLGCNAKYQPLGQLLNAFGEPEWLCTTESGAPAACLTADFTAIAMEAAPDPCAR